MKMLDFFRSTKRPAADTSVLSRQEVLDRLMGLNRPTAPFHLIDGTEEKVDLIAEWKVIDAQWYEIFAKAGLSKVFKIYLKLDPEPTRSAPWIGSIRSPGKLACRRCPLQPVPSGARPSPSSLARRMRSRKRLGRVRCITTSSIPARSKSPSRTP
jgi:hypothetical protein